jgi:hypothetical protein
MQQDTFFSQLNNQSLAKMIEKANDSVIIAAPGIQQNVADALVTIARRLGPEMVVVCLDVSEHSLRLGYGCISAIDALKVNKILVQHVAHLRFALIVVDGKGYSFTPNALYLESDAASVLGFNAIKLTPIQVQEAIVRLSPAAKAIAVAQCENEPAKQALMNISPVIEQTPLEDEKIQNIKKALEEAPPVAFDISRQVRVYNAYLQYVEVNMTGAAIQRQKVSIPKVLQSIGTQDTELEGRLNTSFDLLEKDNKLSSKKLEKHLKELRDSYTPSLGKKHGRVILKSNKEDFNVEIKELKLQLAVHANEVEKSLQASIDESVGKIAQYYLPIVKEVQPKSMTGQLGELKNDPVKVLNWITRQLKGAFPTAQKMISKMEVSVIYKDVTFENLNDGDFRGAIKKAYPDVDWDKAYDEFIAASEKGQ